MLSERTTIILEKENREVLLAKDSYGMIHNGADDNASGVAGLLELARVYSQNNIKEPVNFLFIAFGAEELGLVGSRYFVKNPTYDLNKVLWMLNMDMIGRLNKERGVSIIGYGTSPEFETIFKEIDPNKFVKFYTGYEGRGGSDQTSFYEKIYLSCFSYWRARRLPQTHG